MGWRRYGWNEAKISRYRRMGRGRGEGTRYAPWLTVADVSSSGRSHRVSCDKTGRQVHLLSDTEYFAYLEQWWDDEVVDIREQYPLSRADTLHIARLRRVRHPVDGRTATPLVQTTDLLCTLRDGDGLRLLAIAAKTAADLEDPKRRRRTLEKLDIERTYWTARGVEWRLVTDVDVKTRRNANLSWLHERRLDVSPSLRGRLTWCETALARMVDSRPRALVRLTCSAFDEEHGLDEGTALQVLRGMLRRKAAVTDLAVLQIQDSPGAAFSWPGIGR